MSTYAEKIFLEQQQCAQTVQAEENARRNAIAAKTAKLRERRLAKEAAEREAPKPGKAKGRRK